MLYHLKKYRDIAESYPKGAAPAVYETLFNTGDCHVIAHVLSPTILIVRVLHAYLYISMCSSHVIVDS